MGEKRWVFYDDADEAIEDGITRQTMGYYVADAEGNARAAFWIRGDAERYVRERNREREAGLPKGTTMLDQFTITIDLGNAEMSKPDHVVDALREIADQLEAEGPDVFAAGNVRDVNGNTVGSYGRVSERGAL